MNRLAVLACALHGALCTTDSQIRASYLMFACGYDPREPLTLARRRHPRRDAKAAAGGAWLCRNRVGAFAECCEIFRLDHAMTRPVHLHRHLELHGRRTRNPDRECRRPQCFRRPRSPRLLGASTVARTAPWAATAKRAHRHRPQTKRVRSWGEVGGPHKTYRGPLRPV